LVDPERVAASSDPRRASRLRRVRRLRSRRGFSFAGRCAPSSVTLSLSFSTSGRQLTTDNRQLSFFPHVTFPPPLSVHKGMPTMLAAAEEMQICKRARAPAAIHDLHQARPRRAARQNADRLRRHAFCRATGRRPLASSRPYRPPRQGSSRRMPPQHSKSKLASRRFPDFILGRKRRGREKSPRNIFPSLPAKRLIAALRSGFPNSLRRLDLQNSKKGRTILD
jgi:hypothetical protein